MLISSYNEALVACSIIVAILASYTALNMAGRVASASGKPSLLWLIGGSFAMGFGIWSMHFIGMEAMRMPPCTTRKRKAAMVTVFLSMA